MSRARPPAARSGRERLRALAPGLLLASAVLLAAAGGCAWFAQRPWFDFRRVEVRGELHHVSRAAIRAAVAGRLAGNFFTMRLDETRRAFESVPWVAAAAVRRVWPDRLQVTLTEHRVVGSWSDGRLLSDAGVLFIANAAEAELDGPQVDFAGPPEYAPEVARRLPVFRGVLAPLQLPLAGVEVSERASWALRAGAVQRLDLGRDEPPGTVDARLAAIAAAWPQVAAQMNGTPSRIDARYPNGFAAAP